MLKAFKRTPSRDPIHEDRTKFDEVDETLQPKLILQHEDNLLQSGKVLQKYLIKLKNYAYEDAQKDDGKSTSRLSFHNRNV